MAAALSSAQLDQLVDLVAMGSVVPIVGDDLLAIETTDGPQPISSILARRLAGELGVAAEPGDSLSDVAARFLAIGPKAKMQRVRAELGAIVKADAASWVPAETLRQLAGIEAFTLYLTTGLAPLLADALRTARGVEPTIGAFTSDAREKDLSNSWRRTAPMVYHLFGTASNPGTNFAITEEETLEGLLALKEHGPNLHALMDVLRNSHLLLLGCSYPDWLSRFFLRIARGKRLGAMRDEIEVVASTMTIDAPLVRFLERFSSCTDVLPVTAAALVSDLSKAWERGRPVSSTAATTLSPPSIFVSYATEDSDAAQALSAALKRQGLEVWLDKGASPDALQPGDAFDRRIQDQIAKCELFVPILSRRAAKRVEGYFRTEWRIAIERHRGIAEHVPFLVPVRVDDVDYGDASIPIAMRTVHWVEMPEAVVTDAVVNQFVQAIRTLRLRRAGSPT